MWRAVPPDRKADAAISLNLVSSTTFTAVVMLFVVATTLLPEPDGRLAGLALLAGTVVMAGLFVAAESRTAAPLLPRKLLRQRPLRQGITGALLNTLTTSSVTLATLFLQNTLGRSPLAAALMLLPFSLAVIVGSTAAAPALGRLRPERVVALGLAAIALFNGGLIFTAASQWALPICVALGGAGIGLSSVAATGLGTSVPADARGTASGIINTAAQLGTALGIAVLLLVAAVTTGIPESRTPIPAVAWALAAAISLTGAGTFFFWGRRGRQPQL
jgi:predicted MFS family arabinose efflux permease